MKVEIKDLGAAINIKTQGTRFYVRGKGDKLLGSLYVTAAGVVWCKGKTTKTRGQKLTWKQFISMMSEGQITDVTKTVA